MLTATGAGWASGGETFVNTLLGNQSVRSEIYNQELRIADKNKILNQLVPCPDMYNAED